MGQCTNKEKKRRLLAVPRSSRCMWPEKRLVERRCGFQAAPLRSSLCCAAIVPPTAQKTEGS